MPEIVLSITQKNMPEKIEEAINKIFELKTEAMRIISEFKIDTRVLICNWPTCDSGQRKVTNEEEAMAKKHGLLNSDFQNIQMAKEFVQSLSNALRKLGVHDLLLGEAMESLLSRKEMAFYHGRNYHTLYYKIMYHPASRH